MGCDQVRQQYATGICSPTHEIPQKGEKQVYDRVPSVYYADTADYSNPSRYSSQLVPRYGCKIYTLRPDAEIPGPIDERKAVDLGLSVKWAPFNLGCDHEANTSTSDAATSVRTRTRYKFIRFFKSFVSSSND